MVRSMTGFGRFEESNEKRRVSVEMKSVNHRYCDISVKMPRRYSFAEDKIKAIVKETAKRGKIDVSVMVENVAAEDTNIQLNTALAAQYMDRLTELKETFGLEGEITLQFLSELPDVMKAVPDVEDEQEIIDALSIPVREAAKRHDDMKIVEGEKLAQDILKRGQIIAGYVAEIDAVSDQVTRAYKDKLTERIKDLIGGNAEIPEDQDHIQPLQSRFIIKSVAGIGQSGGFQQADGIVVVQRSGADAGFFADLFYREHTVTSP